MPVPPVPAQTSNPFSSYLQLSGTADQSIAAALIPGQQEKTKNLVYIKASEKLGPVGLLIRNILSVEDGSKFHRRKLIGLCKGSVNYNDLNAIVAKSYNQLTNDGSLIQATYIYLLCILAQIPPPIISKIIKIYLKISGRSYLHGLSICEDILDTIGDLNLSSIYNIINQYPCKSPGKPKPSTYKKPKPKPTTK